MPEDNYQYPIKPLPGWTPIGADSLSASHSGVVEIGIPNVSPASLESPFSNSDFTGGGGGGGDLPTCADSRTIGAIRSSLIELPCTGTALAVITDGGASVATAGGDSASLIAETGVLELVSGGKTVYIQASAIGADSGDIDLKELDTCHMGAPGKRQVLCGNAYAA